VEHGSNESAKANTSWRAGQAYALAIVCLLVGLPVGYLLRGSAPAAAPTPAPVTSVADPHAGASGMGGAGGQMPTLEQMKQMADKQAEPLLAKLKTDPKNFALLVQVGDVYRMTHQFKDAAAYYEKALQVEPKNVPVRTIMASCLYYSGDVDGAIAQLQESLKYDPKHAGTLFNLGMIKWKGKMDADGAIAAWNKLLKLYPNYEKKDAVEKLIAEAKAHNKMLAKQ